MGDNDKPVCSGCGGGADWDEETCYSCRDEARVDAEMFGRGIL